MANKEQKKISPVGVRLKALRKENDWTLSTVSKRTGISMGTLSKLENGHTELNFTSVNKLAEGLAIPVTELTSGKPAAKGMRAITKGGDGVVFETADIDYEVLCSDISNQNQAYIKGVVKAREIPEGMDWHRHAGREFIYVLEGSMDLHSELYEPLRLKTGDSILFDSSVGHHYVSVGRKDAVIMITMSLVGYENVADAFRGKSRVRKASRRK